MPQPSKPSGQVLITRDLFERFVHYYRKMPADITGCAQVHGISYGMAKRAWDQGWTNKPNWNWARPIRDIIAEDGTEARARLAARAPIQEPPAPAVIDAAREDAIKQLQEEARLIRSTGAVAGALFKMGADMFPAMQQLVNGVKDDIAAGRYKGNPSLALKDMGKYASMMTRAAEMANTTQTMEYRRLGKPTDVLSVQHQQAQEMTMEDVQAELEATQDAFERARSKGLALVPGMLSEAS